MAWGKGPPSTIEDFARRLAANDPALRSLTILRFRRLDADDARHLSAALAANAHLEELSAAQHALPAASFGLIARALARPGCGVRSLSLGTGALGDEGAVAVVRGLLGRAEGDEGGDDAKTAAATATAAATEAAAAEAATINASLRHLDLEGRGLGETGAAAVAELLRWHRGLEELDLGGNEGLGDAGARALAAAAATAGATATTTTGPPPASGAPLRRLALHRCGLTHEGVSALASAPFCATLAELSLAENDGLRGAQGGAALAALLAAAPRLRRLDARATGLGDEGVAALAASDGFLAQLMGDDDAGGVSFSMLDLTGAGVGAAGCEALAAALARCSSSSAAAPAADDAAAADDEASAALKPRRLALRLGHNRAMTAGAVAALASALAQAPVADELDVGGAALDAAAVRALAAVPGLRHLSLFSCGGLAGAEEGDAAVQALCEALACPSSFASLEHLGLAACGLGAAALGALLESVGGGGGGGGSGSSDDKSGVGGGAKTLRCIELGGNPGVQDDAFEAAVGAARERRPSLDVAWRAGADGGGANNGEGNGGGGGRGGGGGGGGGPPAPLLAPPS